MSQNCIDAVKRSRMTSYLYTMFLPFALHESALK